MRETPPDDAILAITRPDRSLWTYYWISCLIIPPLFPFVILPAWFKYQTMRYRFTEEGISMSWGLLFRREIIIQYARIQDIHLRSNILERWVGLARVLVQTASGNAEAEMTLEGIREFEQVRDFLYDRMRGVKTHQPGAVRNIEAPRTEETELASALREVAAELRAIRIKLDAGESARETEGDRA